MRRFLILGHSTAYPEQASGVCGEGATQREAAEDYYQRYCAVLGVDPDSMPGSAHHEQMIDVKVTLETSEPGAPVEFPVDDFVLTVATTDVPDPEPLPFAHVDDPDLVKFLMGDVSEDAMCSALTKTQEAFAADAVNPDLESAVVAEREDACTEAHVAWNDEGDGLLALAQLRRFWSM